jgi:C4-dicarboxylate-specific signal transduction histidine kinase
MGPRQTEIYYPTETSYLKLILLWLQEYWTGLRGELEAHNVMTQIELAAGLLLVQGHKSQLQQVIVNLVHNSIEAMDTLTDRRRLFG